MPTSLPERSSPADFRDDDFPFVLFLLIAALGIAAQLWIGVPIETWMPFEIDAGQISKLSLLGP